MNTPQKVVVLLSGGLDSNTALAQLVARPVEEVERVHALTFNYGQSSSREVEAATQLCSAWGVPHTVQKLDLSGDTDTHVEIPARNLIFLSLAARHALNLGFNAVAIGAEPDATYTDSSNLFLRKADELLQLFGVQVLAPVKKLTNKQDLLMHALNLGVPLHLCHSSRSEVVDGKCKTSKLFLQALDNLLPNHRVIYQAALLQILRGLRTRITGNLARVWYDTGSSKQTFKLAPAAFTLMANPLFAQRPSSPITLCSTGSWAEAMAYLLRTYGEKVEDWFDIRITNQVSDLMKQAVNCNTTWAMAGMKQAMSLLPRPRYCKQVACRITQGHLAHALQDLGYSVTAPVYSTGLVIETALALTGPQADLILTGEGQADSRWLKAR